MELITSLFERLANTSHSNPDINLMIESLPEKLKLAFFNHDSNEMRKIISGKSSFPDAKLITQG